MTQVSESTQYDVFVAFGGYINQGILMGSRAVVLAVFMDETTADSAAGLLSGSGVAGPEAIGILALDQNGEVKAEKIGTYSTGEQVGVGVALSVILPVDPGFCSGDRGPLAAVHDKGLGVDRADRRRVGAALRAGRAAVGVLATVDEADAISARLAALGGTPQAHVVSDDALEEALTAATSVAC